ncbi:SDR family NAD(P)-dependent oxidoreductase [Gryllotalpicola reticulitermitis]|uniref:SDR family NAD(P)-dependent oxidoreductase n=1 Tax=Gryllotalpicola reticulitermitis TaxID=1184153 RepID=A0ABV8Q288_9MICO
MTAKTWLITGAGRGFGHEIARAALEAGDQVIATARNPEQIEAALPGHEDHLLAVRLDVTDSVSAADAAQAGLERFGRIDVLVNNAGYGQAGAFEELTPQLIDRQFQTNVFGTFNVTRAVLPAMRAQRSGHILNISSLLGVVGTDWWSVYCATKFAVAGWSEALSKELGSFGIRVTSVHPGQFSTDFLDPSSLGMTDLRIDDYRSLDAERRDFVSGRNHDQPGDPQKFAAAILTLASLEQPPVRWAAGSDALASFQGRAAQLQDSAAQWHELSSSTDSAAQTK